MVQVPLTRARRDRGVDGLTSDILNFERGNSINSNLGRLFEVAREDDECTMCLRLFFASVVVINLSPLVCLQLFAFWAAPS